MIDEQPPGPRGMLAGISNLLEWKRTGLGLLARIGREHGDLARFTLGEYPIYLVNEPSLVRQVLLDNYENLRKPEALEVSNRGHWGDGLTSLGGAAWRDRRRLLQPLFHRDEILRWGPAIVERATAMVARWSPGTDIHLFREFVDLRASIAARITLGARLSDDGHSAAGGDLVPLSEARGQEFVLTASNSRPPFLGMRRPRAAAGMDEMVRIIHARSSSPGERADALSYLARARDQGGRALAPGDLTDELLQMYFAGHLTVATWLTQLCHVLSARPDIDAKVARESTEVLGGRAPTPDDLPRLAYAAQVVKETGRYFAPAPILYREVAAPFRLGGYTLERGVGLWICPQLLHHDPRNFAEPERFSPERFAPERAGCFPRYAYLPFGAGPRICIAKAAALMEMELVLATIFQARRLVPTPAAPAPELRVMPAPAKLRLRVGVRADAGTG